MTCANLRRVAVILLLALTAATSGAADKQSLESLKQQAEEAKEAHQVDLLLKVAERQLDSTKDFYNAGDDEHARAALKDVVEYSTRAGKVAVETGKKLKNAEIRIRKISERLQDIQRDLNVDERPPVKSAVETLEKTRTDLLTRMFKK